VLCYPNNPTGGSYNISELKRLARVAKRFRVVLLSDEIYGELHHKGEHDSIAHFYPEGTIISSGLSKWCGAGGWRLGTFVFPPSLRWLLDAMAVVASETFTATSAPIQFAAVQAFQGGLRIENYLSHSRRILRTLAERLSADLRQAGLSLVQPDGAFYLMVDFEPHRHGLSERGITTSEQLCARLIEDTGVAILPGSVFGRPLSELTARLAYVDFDGAEALTASAEIASDQALTPHFLERRCPRVVRGVERMCEWVAG
jgi:aspartate aminotransferase